MWFVSRPGGLSNLDHGSHPGAGSRGAGSDNRRMVETMMGILTVLRQE